MEKKLRLPALLLLLAIFGSMLLHSCYYDNAEDYYSQFPQVSCDTTAVSYAAQVKPILDNNCTTAGCHSGSFPAGGVDLTTAANAQTHAERIVFRTQQGTMPPSGSLPACEVQTLGAWLNQGKPAN